MVNISGSSLSLVSVFQGVGLANGMDEPHVPAIAEIGGVTYVYVPLDGGLNVFSLDGTGALTFETYIADAAGTTLDGAQWAETFKIGSNNFLAVGGYTDDGITVFSLTGSAPFVSFSDAIMESDDATLNLNSIWSLSVLEQTNSALIYAPGYADNGLGVYSVDAAGSITSIQQIEDNETNGLSNAWISKPIEGTFAFGSTRMIVTSSFADDQISLWNIDNSTGELTLLETLQDAIYLNGASQSSAMMIGNALYIYTPAYDGDAVTVSRYDGTTLEIVQTLQSSVDLNQATETELITLGDAVILAVSSYFSDTVVTFAVQTDGLSAGVGEISVIDILEDNTDGTMLNRAHRGTVVNVDGTDFLLATGELDNAINVFEFGGNDDVLTGTNRDDSIYGGGGDN